MVVLPAFMHDCVCVVGTEEETGGHWAGGVSTGVERQETGCCYQKTGAARWAPQHCLLVANSSQTKSRQLLKKAFDDSILCSK